MLFVRVVFGVVCSCFGLSVAFYCRILCSVLALFFGCFEFGVALSWFVCLCLALVVFWSRVLVLRFSVVF